MLKNATAILFLVLLAAGSQAGALPLGKRYKDETNGFQIQIPRKWEQVPTKFNEVSLIAKWAGKAKKGRFTPECRVLRFLRATGAADDESPADVARRGMPGYASVLRFQPKDIWEYINRTFIGPLSVVEDEADFKMGSKKYKAHLRIYKGRPRGTGRDASKSQLMVVAAMIETVEPSDSLFGVAFSSAVAEQRDMLGAFRNSIKRFKIIDPDEDDEAEGADSGAGIFVDSTQKPEEWRNARKKKLAGLKDWAALDTENYLIVYNKQVKKRLLKSIAKHIEAIRKQIYEKLFPPVREMKAISVLRVCKDAQEYHRYGGPRGSAGYWSRGDEELVFYQDKSNKKDSLRVLYHEAFHQYIHYAVGDVSPHSWFNEGHGDYFAGHNYKSGKFKSDVFRWRTGIISNAFSQKTWVPLRKFLKYTQREYYANPGLCYAQGWSLVYFLREIEVRKVRKYKQYWGLLDRYFEAIKRNVNSVKENAFEGLDEDPEKPDAPEGPDENEDPELGEAPDENGAEVSEDSADTSSGGLPRLPGLESPFPGEHPAAGAAEDASAPHKERKSVAGPQMKTVKGGLDAAVDEAFRRIDIDQLEKDWVEWSK